MEEEAIHKNKDSAKTLNKRTGGKNCLTKSITKMDKLIAKSLATTHHLELLTDEAVQETEAAWGEACIEAAESAITSLEIFQPKLDSCHEGLMILEGMNLLKDNLHSPSPVYERELRVMKD